MDADTVMVSAGPVFAITDRSGNIRRNTADGLYAHDMRFLSTMHLTLNGHPLDAVGNGLLEHSVASFYLTNRKMKGVPDSGLSIVRDRYVSHGMHEDISIFNHSLQERAFKLEIELDSDFADLF